MGGWVEFAVMLGVWLFLQAWLFPRLGVPT